MKTNTQKVEEMIEESQREVSRRMSEWEQLKSGFESYRETEFSVPAEMLARVEALGEPAPKPIEPTPIYSIRA